MIKQIVCFGDSNTHGYDAVTDRRFDESKRWPCLLEKYLGGSYRVMEEGLCGRTTVFDDPLLEGLNGLQSIAPCLLTHEPVDLLVIMLGTNDTKRRFNCSADTIARGMVRFLKKAQSVPEAFRNGVPSILLLAPPPIAPEYKDTSVFEEMGPGCDEKSRKLAALYEAACSTLSCHFLDAGSIPEMHMNTTDYMHLDCNSHNLLAKRLAETIKSLDHDHLSAALQGR